MLFSYLHVVEHFKEGECHSTTDDHLIDLIQHVIDQLDLILNFRSGEGEKERKRTVQSLPRILRQTSFYLELRRKPHQGLLG